MAVNYKNDSYDRCMAELRARYIGRGVGVNTSRAFDAQVAKDEKYMLAAKAEGCIGFYKSVITNEYRSGEYNGSKYMTSSDFVRYFRNRSRHNMPVSLRSAQQSMTSKIHKETAIVGRKGDGRDSLVASDSKEGHLRASVKEIAEKWFPAEPKEGRSVGEKFRFPVSAVGSMAAVALSLGLVVGGSVMIGSASSEIGMLNSEISHLEAQQTELQSSLDLKYNIQDIEKDAKSLGMINKEYADKAYIDVAEDEEIEIYEQEESNIGFSALLNALGIKTD